MKGKSCFGILFGLSIIAGIVLGKMIVPPQPLPITSTPPPEPKINDTILFIGVDHLDSTQPLLEGAWLVALDERNDHPADIIHIKLITLYPIISEHVTSMEHSRYAEPHQPIPIDPNNLDHLKDIPPISFTEETWSYVIIIDEIAMNTIILLTNPNISPSYPTPEPDTFIKPWENPQGAYDQHAAILYTLCEEPDSYAQFKTIQEVVKLNGSHIKTNLDNDGLYKLWQLVNYSVGKKITCSFYP
ncbi:MAG: hypothetical protein P8Y72_04225 [Anaerolineales bacterium]|jgi:hypothetical protein